MIMAINPQVSALFSVLGISANPTQITGQDNNLLLETLAGTEGSDYILGRGGVADRLFGNGGNDYLEGGAGIDTIIGGVGIDTAGYANASNGVTVTMTVNGAGTALGGDGLADTLIAIENIVGSNFNDTILGDNLANVLAGLGGVDTINGGDGNDYIEGGAGADTLTGGAGEDTVSFALLGQRVTLTLSASGGGVATSGPDGDTLTGGFENVVGTAFDDVIIGNGLANKMFGQAGEDNLFAGGGNDRLEGGAGNDDLRGGAGADTYVYTRASDSFDDLDPLFVFPDMLEFDPLDKIDLHAIDANELVAGNQDFVIDSDGIMVPGELELKSNSSGTTFIVRGETGGDSDPEFLVLLPLFGGRTSVTAADFIL
jgi:serralysin